MTLDRPLDTPPDAPLDAFEQALLTDLRAHVASHAPRRRARARRWRWAALPAGAALAVGGTVVALQPAASAYDVSESGHDVVVTIKRLDDAGGLERALRAHGIDADVDYSAEPPTPPPGATTDDGPGTTSGGEPQGAPPTSGAGPTPPPRADIRASLSDDAFTLRIDPDTLPTGAVLHITTSGSLHGLSGLEVSVLRER